MKPLTSKEKTNIRYVEMTLMEFPTCKATQRQQRFCLWLQQKTFPFKFSLDTPGYFREDVRSYNRLAAELICAEIDFDLNYEKDYFHVTLTSEEQITAYEEAQFKWWSWWNKRDAVHLEFSDMFIGSGMTSKMIEEGDLT